MTGRVSAAWTWLFIAACSATTAPDRSRPIARPPQPVTLVSCGRDAGRKTEVRSSLPAEGRAAEDAAAAAQRAAADPDDQCPAASLESWRQLAVSFGRAEQLVAVMTRFTAAAYAQAPAAAPYRARVRDRMRDVLALPRDASFPPQALHDALLEYASLLLSLRETYADFVEAGLALDLLRDLHVEETGDVFRRSTLLMADWLENSNPDDATIPAEEEKLLALEAALAPGDRLGLLAVRTALALLYAGGGAAHAEQAARAAGELLPMFDHALDFPRFELLVSRLTGAFLGAEVAGRGALLRATIQWNRELTERKAARGEPKNKYGGGPMLKVANALMEMELGAREVNLRSAIEAYELAIAGMDVSGEPNRLRRAIFRQQLAGAQKELVAFEDDGDAARKRAAATYELSLADLGGDVSPEFQGAVDALAGIAWLKIAELLTGLSRDGLAENRRKIEDALGRASSLITRDADLESYGELQYAIGSYRLDLVMSGLQGPDDTKLGLVALEQALDVFRSTSQVKRQVAVLSSHSYLAAIDGNAELAVFEVEQALALAAQIAPRHHPAAARTLYEDLSVLLELTIVRLARLGRADLALRAADAMTAREIADAIDEAAAPCAPGSDDCKKYLELMVAVRKTMAKVESLQPRGYEFEGDEERDRRYREALAELTEQRNDFDALRAALLQGGTRPPAPSALTLDELKALAAAEPTTAFITLVADDGDLYALVLSAAMPGADDIEAVKLASRDGIAGRRGLHGILHGGHEAFFSWLNALLAIEGFKREDYQRQATVFRDIASRLSSVDLRWHEAYALLTSVRPSLLVPADAVPSDWSEVGSAYADAALRKFSGVVTTTVAALDAMIGRPLADRLASLGVKRLVVIPRSLGALPLPSLPSWEAYESVSYTPSLRVYAMRAAERKQVGPRPTVKIVGDPTEDLYCAELGARHVAAGHAAVSSTWGASATADAILAQLREPAAHGQEWIIASHAEFDPRSPMESGLRAADRMLLLSELWSEPSDAELVFLLGCETASRDVSKALPEGTTMPGALVAGGAHRVIGALWPVDELASTLLLVRFDRERREGRSIAAALKAAQSWLRSLKASQVRDLVAQMGDTNRGLARACLAYLGDPGGDSVPFADPYYWAGFVLVE